jgi:hypothetical protein
MEPVASPRTPVQGRAGALAAVGAQREVGTRAKEDAEEEEEEGEEEEARGKDQGGQLRPPLALVHVCVGALVPPAHAVLNDLLLGLRIRCVVPRPFLPFWPSLLKSSSIGDRASVCVRGE